MLPCHTSAILHIRLIYHEVVNAAQLMLLCLIESERTGVQRLY